MMDAFVDAFLATYDESRFPEVFLQRYELLECLSHNEMGETVLVKDRQTGERFVAKCYTDKQLLSHTSESDLLKRIRHDGLPTFIGEYQNDQMLCVVRSFSQGSSLDKIVQEKPLTSQQAVDIAVQLCEILVYLHGQTPPIIHRDIKPQNIIVGEHGKVTLIDFGTSRTYDKTSQEDTRCLGTRYYAAPEQYGFSQTDSRTDIFALGVLLCWMLTGSVEVEQAKKEISNRRLTHIITKCTAFAPKDRYASAGKVRDALTGVSTRRMIFSLILASLFILAMALFVFHSITPPNQPPKRAAFQEPLIETAVRLTLDKNETEIITEQDLLSVSELFVFGNKAAADEAAFRTYVESFVKNDGTILRGDIASLEDLSKLKNLRRVYLVYQEISDLTPLSNLSYLETVDLHHNPIKDVAPLSKVTSLTSLFIFDTHVSDLTALHSCPHLSTLDIGYTLVKSTSALDGLVSLRVLMIRKAPLQSLDHIETHPLLEHVYLSETQLLDLSPLLDLPRLQVVEVDESMRKAAESVAVNAQFTIVYQ